MPCAVVLIRIKAAGVGTADTAIVPRPSPGLARRYAEIAPGMARDDRNGEPAGATSMPYRANSDLPRAIRDHLPPSAQTIFRNAFNVAWNAYADNPRREEIAHRVAWAAVKRRYRQFNGAWVPRALTDGR